MERNRPRELAGDSADPRAMAALALQYLEWLALRNYSQHTIRTRRAYLRYFVAWSEERGISQAAEVSRPVLERYQRWLYHYRQKNGQPLTFRSQYSHLVPVRAFFKWLAREHHILHNPASELELPRLEKRLPKHVLTASEADQVLNQTDTANPLGVRDRTILETLYSTGMRRLELIHLKLYDLDIERGTVMIRQGKGKRDRMIPIGDRAVAWIEKYLTEVRATLVSEPDSGILFVTNTGEPFHPDHLSELVRGYVDAAAIGKRGACHLFRHTMATLMLEGGADIRFIQAMLGHADISTTQIYTQVSIRKLKEIHTATHPARLEKSAGPAENDNPIRAATRERPLPEGGTQKAEGSWSAVTGDRVQVNDSDIDPRGNLEPRLSEDVDNNQPENLFSSLAADEDD